MKYLSFAVLTLAAGLFAAGCTKSTPAPAPTGANATTPIDEHAGHDHNGHSHDGEETPAIGDPAGSEAPTGDEFGAPPAEPQDGAAATDGAEPEISLDPASPASPENE
jgi:hypothetical protein